MVRTTGLDVRLTGIVLITLGNRKSSGLERPKILALSSAVPIQEVGADLKAPWTLDMTSLSLTRRSSFEILWQPGTSRPNSILSLYASQETSRKRQTYGRPCCALQESAALAKNALWTPLG
eukprot:1317710-Amphidinium_carterae.3